MTATASSVSQPEVTTEDQANISRFSVLSQLSTDLEAQIEAARQQLEETGDAIEEIELLELEGDDDLDDIESDTDEANENAAPREKKVPYSSGDAFFYLSISEVTDLLTQEKQGLEEKRDEYSSRLNNVRTEMDSLKTVLYAKFKGAINLEK